MKNKEIIIFMPSIEKGGVEKNLFIILKYLTKIYKNVSILTTNKDSVKNKIKKINVISPNSDFWSKKSRFLKYIICSYLLMKKSFINKEIIVLSFQANLSAILLCRLFNIKIIIRANSSSVLWAKNKIKLFIFKKLFQLSNDIIVNSLDLKKEFNTKFNVKSNLIYNPLNKNEILQKSKQKIKLNFFKDSKKTLNVINIGRLTDQKNQILILQALNHLKEHVKFKLLIIGRGKLKSSLQNFITDNNLFSNVKIIDYQKNPYPYIKKSDLFILSSKFEGLPNVLLEAQVLKKPIISSNCPTGPKEILKNGDLGIMFKNNNYKDLVKKINSYLENKSYYQKKASNIKKHLVKYDSNTNLKKYANIINRYY